MEDRGGSAWKWWKMQTHCYSTNTYVGGNRRGGGEEDEEDEEGKQEETCRTTSGREEGLCRGTSRTARETEDEGETDLRERVAAEEPFKSNEEGREVVADSVEVWHALRSRGC